MSVRVELPASRDVTPPLDNEDHSTTQWRKRWWPLGAIVLAVLLGNVLYLVGVTNGDPISWTAGIAHSTCLFTCGQSSIDLNVGSITQPLGHLAALDLWHGHWPWWNPYEGLGQPLAGEMQSAALFPLIPLLIFPAGLLWLHVILETLAGLSTYFLVRRLSMNETVATAAGVLFALNGTFAWLANSVVNPLAFLPMLLLGVEMLLEMPTDRPQRGWMVVAVALALSLSAGFPEVAFFDGLFCVAWATVRLAHLDIVRRRLALVQLGFGAGVGFSLALPTLVPFFDFVRVADVGGHISAVDGTWSLSWKAAVMFVDPYAFGPIYANTHVATTWGEVGGYFGVGLCILAVVGLFGRRLRGLRIFLALWLLAAMAGAFDILGVRALWNLIPLANTASLPRYIMASCEFALVILAALGLEDLGSLPAARRRLARVASLFVVVLALCFASGWWLDHGQVHGGRHWLVVVLLNAIPVAVVASLLLIAWRSPRRWMPALVAATLTGAALLWFLYPTSQAPTHIAVDTAPVTFLDRHLGQHRFVDLAVLYPNWGSQFEVNAVNAIDVPFPLSYSRFIQRYLYPGLRPSDAFTRDRPNDALGQERELVTHLRAYENASVKYVLAQQSLQLVPQLTALGVREVFHDAHTVIYELPRAAPFFTASNGCSVKRTSFDAATVTCDRTGATLTRRELAMSGWSATVNGRAVSIASLDGVYQGVALPTGTSRIRFAFSPPHEDLAVLGSLVAVAALLGGALLERRARATARAVATAETV